MKSAKQNTIRQSIDRHRIALIESKQRFTTTKQSGTRQAADGCKIDLARHRLLIKLDPASK